MKVKFKKLHPDAVIPKYGRPGDAGMDLTAISVEYDKDYSKIIYNTGLAIEIPEGYVGLIFPRSSIFKKELSLSNSVGVIDSSYRGEISFKFNIDISFYNAVTKDYNFQSELEWGKFQYYKNEEDEYMYLQLTGEIYKMGDRVGQLIILPYPQIEFEEVDELSDTDRGLDGFGSTGM